MDITVYMVDKASIQALSEYQITRLFEKNNPITKDDCDRAANYIAGEPVESTPAPGMTSYTVIAGTGTRRAVQFRAPSAAIDMKVMELARETYIKFVPSYVTFSIAQRQMCTINNLKLLERSVQDLAKFFASSWTRKPDMTPWSGTTTTLTDLSQQLKSLTNSLPKCFHAKLNEARDQLPLLFTPDHPQVLNHADLWDMNIHVNLNTGAITGIVDWRDATVGPFGLSFWGFETLLGTLGSDGWHFHASHLDLREIFWNTLYNTAGIITESQKQAVHVGRIVGIFQAYGLRKGVPVEAGDPSLSILERVLTWLEIELYNTFDE